MAIFKEMNEEAWHEWVKTRPESVKKLCHQFPPNRLYLLKSSGHRVTVYSYNENGTMTVNISGEFNAVMFDRRVFGIEPDELEECDLPDEKEVLGTVLKKEDEVKAYINLMRGKFN